MKRIDLIIGVRAEQSLRDAVRQAAEEPEGGLDEELCPVGRKDWVAGRRLDGRLTLADIQPVIDGVARSLMRLESYQRVRRDSIRLWAVAPPVPVFKNAEPDLLAPEEEPPEPEPAAPSDSVDCPVCRRRVNRFNAQHDPDGRIVGCFICRGESGPWSR